MVVEKKTKISKNFNIERHIGVLNLASTQAGVKVSSLQTKLMANFILKNFKGAVPLLTHEKNLKPNLVIFLRFFVALKL